MTVRDMVAAGIGERIRGILSCACAGGFAASTAGFYLGSFPGLDLAGAIAAAAACAWADLR